MSMCRACYRRPIPSLVTLSTDCVVENILKYTDFLVYLPSNIKERILRKLTRNNKFPNLQFNKIISVLVIPNLKVIDLTSVSVDDLTLNILKKSRELTEINLRNCGTQSFSSDGLKTLFKQTPKLLVLDISYCYQFNDEVLECLSINCKNLRELSCEGCSITDNSLGILALYNKQIKCLSLSNTNITGSAISNAVNSKNWKFLQELRLDNCSKVNDDVLRLVIENCPKIEILTFFNCPITDETSIFQDITNTCKNLKELHWTINW